MCSRSCARMRSRASRWKWSSSAPSALRRPTRSSASWRARAVMGLVRVGGIEFAREVIERALGPERAAELLGRIAPGAEARPFEFLRRVPPERISALLRNESPQTAALILASLPTSLAATVLARLPEPQQPDIALRIARMGHTDAHVIETIEDVVRHKLTAVSEREYTSAGGTKALGGNPQPRRPHARAQRAREPRLDRSGHRRGGPRDAVRLRGHRQAR